MLAVDVAVDVQIACDEIGIPTRLSIELRELTSKSSGELPSAFNLEFHSICGGSHRIRSISESFPLPNGGAIYVVERTYAAGEISIQLVKVAADGSVDSSFGSQGMEPIAGEIGEVADGEFIDAAVTADGKIVFAIERYAPDSILIGDPIEYQAALRFNADGTPDESFGNEGVVELSFAEELGNVALEQVIATTDGSIFVVGRARQIVSLPIIRLNQDGSVDASYQQQTDDYLRLNLTEVLEQRKAAADGMPTPGNIEFEVQLDGSTYGAMWASPISQVVTADGSTLMIVEVAHGTNVDAARNGLLIVKVAADGLLDQSFGEGGVMWADVGVPQTESASIALFGESHFVVVGGTQIRRYEVATGAIDFSFNNIPTRDILQEDNDYRAISIDSQGQIYAIASNLDHTQTIVYRFRSNGVVDPRLGHGTGVEIGDVGMDKITLFEVFDNSVRVTGYSDHGIESHTAFLPVDSVISYGSPRLLIDSPTANLAVVNGEIVTIKSDSPSNNNSLSFAWDLNGNGNYNDHLGPVVDLEDIPWQQGLLLSYPPIPAVFEHRVSVRITDSLSNTDTIQAFLHASSHEVYHAIYDTAPLAEITQLKAGNGTISVLEDRCFPSETSLTHAWDLDNDGQFDDHFSDTVDMTDIPLSAINTFGLSSHDQFTLKIRVGLRTTDAEGNVTETFTEIRPPTQLVRSAIVYHDSLASNNTSGIPSEGEPDEATQAKLHDQALLEMVDSTLLR